MKREREEELRSARGSTTIAFFDLAERSTSFTIVYLLGVATLFGGIIYILS